MFKFILVVSGGVSFECAFFPVSILLTPTTPNLYAVFASKLKL